VSEQTPTPELLDGQGWVYFNPDAGEEYASNHPVHSGEVPEAEHIRRSTGQEDALHTAYQAAFEALTPIQAAADVVDAARKLACEFAWSAVTADCEESGAYLQGLVENLRAALARIERPVASGETLLTPDMMAFGAADAACYEYPGEDQTALREAFCKGAVHALSTKKPPKCECRIDEGMPFGPCNLCAASSDMERMAMAMAPDLFRGSEESVGPATRYEREKLRRYARAALDSLTGPSS
jgi:hypothetical protein